MRRKMVLAALPLFLLLSVAAVPVHAQIFCTTPGVPPAPPAPPQPPSVCGDRACGRCTGSPCYVASGVYVDETTDLLIPTVGPPLVATRTYDSSRVLDGPVGIGWKSSLRPHLYSVTSTGGSGSAVTYIEYVADGYVVEFTVVNGTTTAPPGRQDKLVLNGDGTYDLTPQWTRSKDHFNADGTIASDSDEYGNALVYSYDTSGRLSRLADQTGSNRAFDITWGPDGRLSMVTDNIGRSVHYGYGPDGTLTSVMDPLSHSTTNAYARGRFGPMLVFTRDHWNRLVTALTWDSIGRVQSYTEGDPARGGELYTYSYNPGQQVTSKTNGFGTEIFAYDPHGLVTNHERRYDAIGRLVEDFSGAYEYDALNRVVSQTRGGVKWVFTYDPDFPTSVSSSVPNSVAWPAMYYEYAPPASPTPGSLLTIKQKRSDSTVTEAVATYAYTPRGLPAGEWTADGDLVTLAYDATTGDMLTKNDRGLITRYSHDAVGRIVTISDAANHATSYTYDALGRVLTTTLPPPVAGSSLLFRTTRSYDEYDAASGLLFITITDANGNTTRAGYDVLGHMIRYVDSLGKVITYSYMNNMLFSMTDANGNVTTYTYDAERRPITVTFPDGQHETYGYAGTVGAVSSKIDRNGVTSSYSYDAFGRQTGVTYSSGGGVSYGYNGAMLASMSRTGSVSEVTTFTYDTSYRVSSETQGDRVTVSYSYSPDTASKAPAGVTVQPINLGPPIVPRTIAYMRDQYGRVVNISWSRLPGNAFRFTYTPNGDYDTITFPNDQTRKYAYDDQDRLLRVENRHPSAGLLASFNYEYDHDWATNTDHALGQRTSVDVTSDLTGTSLPIGRTRYRYDANYQLTRADYPSGSWDAWSYDDLGNRTLAVADGVYAVPSSYYLNVAGKNTMRFKSSSNSGVHVYDANGNVSAIDGVSLIYDPENHLLAYGAATLHRYDADGRRYLSLAGSDQRFFFYDGLNPVTERVPQTGVWNDYVFGPGIDEVMAVVEQESATRYMVVDGLGSVVLRNDAAGNLIDSANYTPWGEIKQGGVASLFGYTGREGRDDGQWYYRARFYEPASGRFLSEDPLRFEAGANLYRYVENDPVNYVDPEGLSGSRPGSPYHPPEGVATGCTRNDSCAVLIGKMWLLKRMIDSHTGWDRVMSRPRGGNRHAQEIAELWSAYARCQAIYQAKCVSQPPRTCTRCQQAAQVAAGIGTGYIIYRCVRMIPSLFFPPTIPLNAAIP
jgi:RHS repeat-associated protein